MVYRFSSWAQAYLTFSLSVKRAFTFSNLAAFTQMRASSTTSPLVKPDGNIISIVCSTCHPSSVQHVIQRNMPPNNNATIAWLSAGSSSRVAGSFTQRWGNGRACCPDCTSGRGCPGEGPASLQAAEQRVLSLPVSEEAWHSQQERTRSLRPLQRTFDSADSASHH